MRAFLAAFIALAAAAAPLSAGQAAAAAAAVCVEVPAGPVLPAGGWRAFRDPSTGRLREPTPEEAMEASRRALRPSAAPIVFEVITHPDGMTSVDLKGAFSMSVVARRRPDGSISYACEPSEAPDTTKSARPAPAENR